ncbi:MAG: hypothetical protein N3A54_05450, partial [Patescibacteria group bacterium]|nr:hypothetical protein [Patescibacteria group bacterium]
MKILKNTHINFKNNGSISILVLVIGIVTSVAIGGLVVVSGIQYNNSIRTDVFERALAIAQAGAEYYRWHLAHDPMDFADGTGRPGPYVHSLQDPYGNTEGTFSLMITPPASGSSNVTIESTGWINSYPEIKRKVIARYGIPSLARFSFLHNANIWFGSGITVQGKVMSNGGIRMDGTNLSTVSSARATYTCGQETGCSPSQQRNGVWGSGGPSNLWEFPVPAIDFASLNLDFNTMRTQAQTNGLYLSPSGALGYHVIFSSNGSYTVRRVTAANNQRGHSAENGCENLNQQITNETTIGTYSIAQRSLIFAEDHLWVEGVVNGKVTVVAARFPLTVNFMNIWIPNNLVYIAKDGHSNLGLFAQNNIYFAKDIPNNFEINGALLASSGRIIRHNYNQSGCSNFSNAVRNSLTIYG